MSGEIVVDPANGQQYVVDSEGNYLPRAAVSGPVQAGLVAAGGALHNLGRGAESIYNRIATRDPAQAAGVEQQLAQEQQQQNEQMAPIKAEYPVSSFLGNVAPSMATLPISGGLPVQAGVGAVTNMMDYNPDQGAVERGVLGAAGAGMGKVGGDMTSNILSRIAEIGKGARDKVLQSQAAQDLVALGGKVTKGQQIGSDVVRQAEIGLARNPASSSQFFDIANHNQVLGNQAAARSIGISPDQLPNGKITEDILSRADDNLSQVFNNIGQNVGKIDMGADFGKKLLGLEQFKKLRLFGDLPQIDQGIVSGKDYQIARQALVEEGQSAADRGQGQLMTRINSLVDDLDNAAGKYIPPDQMQGFTAAREQWRNLKVLQQSNVIRDGDVSASVLANRLGNNYGTTYKQNRVDRVQPETANLFKTIKALSSPDLKPIVGDSGTATGLMANGLLKDLAGAATFDPAAIKNVAKTYGTGALYNSLSPDALDVLLRSGSPLAAGVGSRLGSEAASGL